MSRGRTLALAYWLLPLLQLASVVFLALWLLYWRLPLGNEEWYWRVRREVLSVGMLRRPLLIVLGFAALSVYLAYRIQVTRSRLARRVLIGAYLVGLWLGSFSLGVSLFSLNQQPVPLLAWIMGSDVSTEYYRTAWEIEDVRAFGDAYPAIMERAGYHVATHPPGAVLFYYGVIRAYRGGPWAEPLETALQNTAQITTKAIADAWPPNVAGLPSEAVAPAVFSVLLTGLLGASTVIPIFFLAASLGGERGGKPPAQAGGGWAPGQVGAPAPGRATRVRAGARHLPAGLPAGLAGAAVFATMPALLFFFQTLDQVVLCLSAWAVCLSALGLTRGRRTLGALGGAIFGLDTFVSFGPLALAPVLLFMWLRGRSSHPDGEGKTSGGTGRWPVHRRAACATRALDALTFVGSMVVVWVGLSVALRLNPVEILAQGLGAHRHVTTEAFRRTYSTWVFLNLADFSLFFGLPMSMALLWAPAFGNTTRSSGSRTALLGLAMAALMAMLLVDVTGVVRAEVGRIWVFFMPILIPDTVEVLLRTRRGGTLVGATVALQLAQVLLMGLVITPVWPW